MDKTENIITGTVRRLRKTSNVIGFTCGDLDLDDFLIHESFDFQKARISTT